MPLYLIVLLSYFLITTTYGTYVFFDTKKEALRIKQSILRDKAKEELFGRVEGWEFMVSQVKTANENQPLIRFLNEMENHPFRFHIFELIRYSLLAPFLFYVRFASKYPNKGLNPLESNDTTHPSSSSDDSHHQ